MINSNDIIYQIVNTFYKSTGIGILCFDTKLNIVEYCPSKKLLDDLLCLGMSSITAFLTEEYSASEIKKDIIYTFFLESNLVCNIVFLYDNTGYTGAFVTQPVFVNKLSPKDMEKLLNNLNLSAENQKTLKSIFLRTPVVSYDRIMPAGYVLSSLLKTFFYEQMPRQILKGGSNIKMETDCRVIKPAKNSHLDKEAITRHSSYSDYLKIKENIQRGDTETLLSFINKINAGSIPMDQLNYSNYVRSLKNNLIKVCSMSCYAAIEANAQYYKMLDLADEFIRKMETLENINDIYELMKNAMVSFTRAVAVSRKTSYSKPIRVIIEYIENHYAEKITLEMLASQTNLSTSYLSNMIKKETGLSLTDNINKVRVEQSKKLLLNTNLSSQEVAVRVGFSYQNHFASIFKKFTGVSPTDFRNPISPNQELKFVKNAVDELCPGILEELRNNLSKFNCMYDIVRIVDPINHISWIIPNNNSDNIRSETCYDFWERNESCKNCISTMAYLKNDTFVKIDQQNENVFMVLATPKIVGKNTYVIVLLKNISDKVYIDIDTDDLKLKISNVRNKASSFRDELTGLYNRQYIDEILPVCFRKSILDKTPFSIILSFIDCYDSMNNQDYHNIRNKALCEYSRIILGSLENHEDWAGLYSGSVFLTVLSNADYDEASRIAEKIENKFIETLSQFNKNDIRISLKYSVKTRSENIQDAESLIKLASINLHDDVNFYKRFNKF